MRAAESQAPVGWRVFSLVLNTFVVSCLLAWFTTIPEKYLSETMDSIVQAVHLKRIGESRDALVEECVPQGGAAPCVVLVPIRHRDYESEDLFRYTSPLDPEVLRTFFDGLVRAAQAGNGPAMVVADLDLAPTSDDDAIRREPLYQALTELSRRVPVLLVCPQSYYLGTVAEREQAFVERWLSQGSDQGPGVRFAGAVLDRDGLYYYDERPPLGAVAARWWQAGGALPARNPCALDHVSHEAGAPSPRLIVPARVDSIGFGELVRRQDGRLVAGGGADLKDRIVVLGGTYGTDDLFRIRGVEEPTYGVILHTWILQQELAGKQAPKLTFRVMLDIAVGIFAAILLSMAWGAAVRTRHRYSVHMAAYALFMLLVVGMPLLLIALSILSVANGITLGTAGMVISALFDSLNTTKNLDSTPEATGKSSERSDTRGLIPTGRDTWVRLAPAARQALWGIALLGIAVSLLYAARLDDEVGIGLAGAVLLGAMAVCGVVSCMTRPVNEPPSASGPTAVNWAHWAREGMAWARFDSQGAWLVADRLLYGLWTGLKLCAVARLLSDGFSADVDAWDWTPMGVLASFGAGCWVFDGLRVVWARRNSPKA